jgi:hypothetical protein
MVVTPPKAGVQNFLVFLDPRFHGNDSKKHFPTFYEFIKIDDARYSQVFYIPPISGGHR